MAAPASANELLAACGLQRAGDLWTATWEQLDALEQLLGPQSKRKIFIGRMSLQLSHRVIWASPGARIFLNGPGAPAPVIAVGIMSHAVFYASPF